MTSRTCGAKTKGGGAPCRRRSRYSNGRCRLHGGASTGPRTPEGKAASSRNGRLGGRPRKWCEGSAESGPASTVSD
ncbi:hypothetical protein ETQ85_17720 [Zoogloea oleivorans]|uniref:Uncharacterized protein n=1 Tax=Zoogloea oleivorans TaxID=1552750 RepID=A0A6C2CNJ4_9RHOO|nr:hypothetical protein ETQ85_17720 [Zoogloea oleivorans]